MVAMRWKAVAAAIEAVLCEPPSQAGMRLRPERELCGELKVSRVTLRRALEALVTRGILARRHGSGTYVRKLPQPPAGVAPASGGRGQLRVEAASLFVPAPPPEQRLHIPTEKGALTFVLWRDRMSEAYSLILQGMGERVREHGHRLAILVPPPADAAPGAREQFLAKAARPPADGYVVPVTCAALFREFCAGQRPPVVYCGCTNIPGEPVVWLDLAGAIRQAVGVLAAAGHRRVGFISWDASPVREEEQAAYASALRDCALPPLPPVVSALTDEGGEAAVEMLFARPDAPEALYVGDDIVLRHLLPALERRGLIPGRTLAVTTLANYGVPLPGRYDWSCFEFNEGQLGCLIVDCLLREVTHAGEPVCALAHQVLWRPGTTHLRAG